MAVFLSNCVKQPTLLPNANPTTQQVAQAVILPPSCPGLIDSMPPVTTDADSVETPTILGIQHTNPYLVPNMQQAYANLGVTGVSVAVTNLYVRFLPNSGDQLSLLDSTLDAQGLELFDTPMDYDITKEGDYYQDPTIPAEQITYQYAVVPPGYVPPAGIAYTVLAQIHIPTDTYVGVETEAERLASLVDCSGSAPVVKPPTPFCNPGCHWDFPTAQCLCCASGYTWDGTRCVPICSPGYYWDGNNCIQLPITPPPAPDAAIPTGNITVTDNNLNSIPGVRNLRIVAKRWFKVERGYTDDNGHFAFTKRFKHKVKINAKFKNTYCNIRGIRGIRFWQSLYVIKNTLGVYSGNKSNITYNYPRYANSTGAKGNRYWVAATTLNAVQEHKDYAAQYAFTPAPTGMNIYLTNWGLFDGLASTPLFGKRFISDLPSSYINTYLVGAVSPFIPFIGATIYPYLTIARTRLDMAICYHRADMSTFTSDFIKENVYHECSHASHYNQVGTGWYGKFVNAELAEIIANPSGQFNPYGTGNNTSTAPIIALGEAWGYHMGHFLANKKYNVEPSTPKGDTKLTEQNFAGGFVGNDADILENFYPSLTSDPFKWIPKGLMWDLMDIGEPNRTNVIDQVSNYTTSQIFAALQSDVTTVQQFRARLIQQNPLNQTTQITNLFASYNY